MQHPLPCASFTDLESAFPGRPVPQARLLILCCAHSSTSSFPTSRQGETPTTTQTRIPDFFL